MSDTDADQETISLNDAWEHYYSHSGSASSNARKLAFTGIALVWIFSGGGLISADEVTIHGHYEWPLYLLILALGFDLLQYVYFAAAWRAVTFWREQSDKRSERFRAPTGINFLGEFCFVIKVVLVIVGYVWLLYALYPKLNG